MAPNSCRIAKPSAKAFGGGACTNGNSRTSPKRSALGAQDNGSEIRAHDLWIGECRPTSEILFTVKPNTDAFRYAAAAARALVGRSLTNGLNEQLLDLGAIRIAFDTRVTGIHHIADARER